MGKSEILLHLLWGRGFMGTSKDVCTYYTLGGREYSYDNIISLNYLKGMMQNCVNFIEEYAPYTGVTG